MLLLSAFLDGQYDSTACFIIQNQNEAKIQDGNYCVLQKKNESMSYDTYMERKSLVDIYAAMKLKTLKLIIALS